MSMLNFEPFSVSQYQSCGHDFNSLESTLFEDTGMVISQILEKTKSLKYFPIHFYVELEPRLGAAVFIGPWVTVLTI